MKKIITIFVTVFAAFLSSNAQSPATVDSVVTSFNSATAYVTVDSGEYIQFKLMSSGMVQIGSPSQWYQSQSDTMPIDYTFTGLDTMTGYYIMVDKVVTFPTIIAGVPYYFVTDTVITMPVISRDTTLRYPSLGAARLYFTVDGGYDTSFVEVQVNTNPSFTGFGNSVLYSHINWGGGSGNLYFTGLPQNQTLYKRYRVRNSQYVSNWLFNANVDTFALWTNGVVPATVSTDDSVANYNSVTLNGSATQSNLLRIRWAYSYADVSNTGGYVAGIVNGSQSSLTTSATISVVPGDVIYYRAESETSIGVIYGNIKSVTAWNFPVMTMPITWTDTSFTDAEFVFSPNTGGITVDSFVVTVGSPTLSTPIQSFHVSGGLQSLFTVINLTAGNQYQLNIKAYAFGVVAVTSATVTFYTSSQGTVQTSAAWGEVTGVQDQLMIGTTLTSRVQLQVQSENLASTAWIEINNDWDTTNFYSPVTFTLPSYTTGASPVYESYDVAASDVPESWDSYSDVYGRYIARVIIYNADNPAPYYGDWQYFYPRGLPSGITEEKEPVVFTVFPNPTSDNINVSLQDEETVELYTSMGQLLASEKGSVITFSTANFSSGIYLVKVGHTTKKIVKQ